MSAAGRVELSAVGVRRSTSAGSGGGTGVANVGGAHQGAGGKSKLDIGGRTGLHTDVSGRVGPVRPMSVLVAGEIPLTTAVSVVIHKVHQPSDVAISESETSDDDHAHPEADERQQKWDVGDPATDSLRIW